MTRPNSSETAMGAKRGTSVSVNGAAPRFPPIQPPAASDPASVIYRGRVRRVYGVVRARHQGHRQYLLRYKRGHAPENAHQTVIGPRGQARFAGVIVRADHVHALRGVA